MTEEKLKDNKRTQSKECRVLMRPLSMLGNVEGSEVTVIRHTQSTPHPGQPDLLQQVGTHAQQLQPQSTAPCWESSFLSPWEMHTEVSKELPSDAAQDPGVMATCVQSLHISCESPSRGAGPIRQHDHPVSCGPALGHRTVSEQLCPAKVICSLTKNTYTSKPSEN